jgi:acetyltransferase-like isoleucine patch superfamily enzyme
MYTQNWTVKKICCYFLYLVVAKHISSNFPLIRHFGSWMRRVVCRPLFLEADKVISIGQGVDFDNGCFLRMRYCANIGDFAILAGNYGTITIGRHVMMGKYCIIICQNHKYTADGYDGYIGKDVEIDDYAWIGHGVTILPGVRVGKHAIIGAGAVVSKNIPDYAVAVGNPAVVKKYRPGHVHDDSICHV